MVRGTAVNPMTKKPVDAAVLLTLVREIAPPDLRDAIDTDETRDFRYASPSGEVDVAWRPAEGTGGGTATLSLVALEADGIPRNYHRVEDVAEDLDMACVIRSADFAVAVAVAWLRGEADPLAIV